MDRDNIVGRGYLGPVCKATNGTGDLVAAKPIYFLHETAATEGVSDFRRLKQLDHQNVVKVHDVIQQGSKVWIFMDHCDKIDLVHYFDDTNCISGGEKLKLMLDISRGVEYLHSCDIVHRDIRPSNVLVTGSPPAAKLSGFSFCSFPAESLGLMSADVGTEAFQAPEFYMTTAEGELSYDRSIDIFAMGLTFLAMIQENVWLIPEIETPQDRCEPNMLIGHLISERMRHKVSPLEAVKIDDSKHDLVTNIRRLIRRMTHVEPAQRPTAAQVVEELQRLRQEEVRTVCWKLFVVMSTEGANFDILSCIRLCRAKHFQPIAQTRFRLVSKNTKRLAMTDLACVL